MGNRNAKNIALGGMLAAVAVVIMCLGGLVPLATFVCPMLCTICQYLVNRLCGKRIGWAWYIVVSILCLLLGPDKEAAAVYLLLGYYPILKPWIDSRKFRWFWKGVLFNGAVAALYGVVLKLIGLDALSRDYQELGLLGLVVMLILGNISFFLLDRLLSILSRHK